MHDWVFRFVISSLSLCHSIYSSDCPFNWFGPKCDIKCNCENNSDCDNGRCPRCRNGYFHHLCQYLDLIWWANIDVNEDGDEFANITVRFDSPHFFTWMEVIPKNIESFSMFPIMYGVDGGVTCLDMRMQKKYDQNAIIFRCLRYTLVSHMVFVLTPASNFSDMHISGGVNIASKQDVTAVRLRQTPETKENLVDANSSTCTTLYKSKSGPPYITIRLAEPQWVQKIMILGRLLLGTKHNLTVMIYYGGESETLKRSTYNFNKLVHLYHPTQLKRATRVTILGLTLGTDYLELCEIVIYVDCLSPSYGLRCQDICSIGCHDLLCHTDGECFECLPGMTGFHCLDYNDTDEEEVEDYEEEEKEVVKKMKHSPKTKDPFISGTDFLLMLLFSSAFLAAVTTFVIYIVCKICTLDETSIKSVPVSDHRRKTVRSIKSIRMSTSLKSGVSRGSNSPTMYSLATSASKRRSGTE